MPNETYFVRLTYSYERIQAVVSQWSLQSERLVCYEHVGTKTEKVHCHILIEQSRVGKKRLQQIAKLIIPTIKGNECMSFKTPKEGEDPRGAITYMSKGTLDPKYFIGYERTMLDELRANWVDRPKTMSRYEKLYCDFVNYYNELAKPIPNSNETPEEVVVLMFSHLTTNAKKFVFSQNNRIWTPRCVNDYKCIIYTYVMRYQMRVPPNSLFRKELL